MFDAITKINYLGEPYTALKPLPARGWAILGLLRSRPFTPVPYEDLAAAIDQDPTIPVHRGTNGSPTYNLIYLIRRHLAAASSLDRVVRLSPFPGAPQGGYMYLPSTPSRK